MAGAAHLGPWVPLAPSDVVELFRDAPFRWWITGGVALDRFAGRTWREHEDADVSVLRADVPAARRWLDGWDLHVAAAGVLTPYDGRDLAADRHENNAWCRRSPDAPWCLDLTVGDGDAHRWIYRRDDAISLPWSDALISGDDGAFAFAPEVQLLFKSVAMRPKDDVDAGIVIPLLGPTARSRLRAWLPAGHPWHALLTS